MRASRVALVVLGTGLAGGFVFGQQPAPQRGAAASPAATVSAEEKPLLGSWKLVRDDDIPGQKVNEEVITFSPDRTWRVTNVATPFGGRFRVHGEEVVMIMTVEGNDKSLRRGFKLDAEGLHFANHKEGSYAHYVRVKRP